MNHGDFNLRNFLIKRKKWKYHISVLLLFSVKIFIEIGIVFNFSCYFFIWRRKKSRKRICLYLILWITESQNHMVHLISRYRLAVRIGISVYDAFFKNRFLRCDIVLKRNSDFTQQSRTRSSRWCCNQNQKSEVSGLISDWKIE